MNQIKMRGAVAPMLTVFNKDESINVRGTLDHVDFLLESGVTGIIACGSTGESVAMTPDERKLLAQAVIQHVEERVPVFVSTGTYRTQDTIELSMHAKSVGGDGLLVMAPYYMQPTTGQLLEHFRRVAEAVDLPVMLYDNPNVTGFTMLPSQIARMAEEGVIRGVKLTGGDPTYVHLLKHLCGDALRVFYGADSAPLEGLLSGADGWISGIVNLAPDFASRLCAIAASGDAEAAREHFDRIIPLMQFQLNASVDREPHWLSFLKTAMAMRGRDVGDPRRPLLPLSRELQEALAPILNRFLDSLEGDRVN